MSDAIRLLTQLDADLPGLTEELARIYPERAIAGVLASRARMLTTPAHILNCAVSAFTDVTAQELLGCEQNRTIVKRRYMVMDFLWRSDILAMTVTDIARFFSRDHTTVLYGLPRVHRDDLVYQNALKAICEMTGRHYDELKNGPTPRTET